MLDTKSTDQHSVHYWLVRAAVLRHSSVILLNASFSLRHRQRHPCYAAFVRYADLQPTQSFVGVSFHTSYFIPRYASLRSPDNIRWVVMERTYPSVPQAVAPYVAFSMHLHSLPWAKRSLVFMAGHIPKPRLSTVRSRAIKFLKGVPDATVVEPHARLSFEDYTRAIGYHKFCVVAPGDTHSTHKLAETIVLGAHGGCIPLLLSKLTMPYSSMLNYNAFSLHVDHLDESVISRLRNTSNIEYKRFAKHLKEVEHFFSQPDASFTLLKYQL